MDIYKIGYIYFTDKNIEVAKSNNKPIDNKLGRWYITGFLGFFLKFIYSLILGKWNYIPPQKEYEGCLFYGLSNNTRVTLLPIIKQMNSAKLVCYLYPKQFPSWRLYWYALPHIFDLLKAIKCAIPEDKPLFKLFFSKFWRMYGCEKVAAEMLEYYKPKVVVMANDHLEFNRCLLFEAKKRNIKTIYVQHASVGTNFPPLQFSFSMLDGQDSFNKYKKVGDMEGSVYLCGGVRFDPIKQIEMSSHVDKQVGVAINLLDREPVIKEICIELQKRLKEEGVMLCLRPHPQMSVNNWKLWCENNGILFSSPASESSFKFILRQSVVISNQCSIHLDSAMCHVPSIIYNMADRKIDDVYLFVRNSLVKEAASIDDLMSFIRSADRSAINEDAVKYYNCSYGANYEGHVAEMISTLVNAICKDRINDFNETYHFSRMESDSRCTVYKS